MDLRSLIPTSIVDDAIISREPFTIAAWVKGDKIVQEVALWKRRFTESEKIELRNGIEESSDEWKFLIYEYDPKKARQYKIVRH